MALSILDGNQSATTLSTILSSGQHITAHTVVSLGTQAITDMRSAVSGSVVSISNFPSSQVISGTVTANPTGTQTIAGTVTVNSSPNFDVRVTQGGDPVDGNNAFPVYGTVTANIPLVNIQPNVTTGLGVILLTDEGKSVFDNSSSIKATLTTALPAGTNRIGVVTIGGGTVTIGAGTAQIGSVTASISNSLTISSLPTISGTVTVGVLPDLTTSTDFEQAGTQIAAGITNYGSIPVAILAGTAQIGSVTASISNSVVTFYPMQGTTVTNSNFTSTTASTTLVSAVAGREVLTVYSEGPGQLFISPGATCTSASYQVRLSPGDYWECPAGQLSLAHTAVFATAGTARVTEVS